MRKIITLAIVAATIAGCSLAPRYETPQTLLPSSEANATISKTWWKQFNDPALDRLMDEALENNMDVMLAVANIAKARAALGMANAQLYPSLNAAANASRSETKASGSWIDSESYSLNGVLSYELDLWGRLRDAKQAALSSLLAMEATKDAAFLSLSASVAESYFALLTLERNIDSVQNLLDFKKAGYVMRKRQYAAGAISELVFARVEADISGTTAQLEELLYRREAAATALAVLIGRSPKAIVEDRILLAKTAPNVTISTINLPSDLIGRRPDIKAAEESLKAANYAIGQARAAYFPSISLTGSAGYQSSELGDLMKSGSAVTQISGGVSVPIFDFGRIGANVDAAKADKDRAIIGYRQSVQKAFAEAHSALIRRDLSSRRLSNAKAQSDALERAMQLTRRQYEAGYMDYIEVIDAEGLFLNAKINENDTRLENLSAIVNLFKALGGGWEAKPK
jgi:multidrug efflux system outer membrane protein